MEYLWTVKIYLHIYTHAFPLWSFRSLQGSIFPQLLLEKNRADLKVTVSVPLDPFAKILSKGQINFSPALYVSDMPHPVGNRYSHVEIVKL